jgi:hypothetical protein
LQLLIALGSHHLIRAAAANTAALFPGASMSLLSEKEKKLRLRRAETVVMSLVDERRKLVRVAECVSKR